MNKTAYYFIGIGGIGMSSIARFLLNNGALVAGYDKSRTPLTKALEDEGVRITYNEEVEHIPAGFEAETTKVIFTPAIPASHAQKLFLKPRGTAYKNALLFWEKSPEMSPPWPLREPMVKPLLPLFWRICLQQQSSLSQLSWAAWCKLRNRILFLLAWMLCSWRPMNSIALFLQLHPQLACITSIDPDHLDIYGSAAEVELAYKSFFGQIKQVGIVEKSIPFPGLTYSIKETADYHVTQLQAEGFGYRFDLHTPKNSFEGVYFSQLGLHNLSNALAAFALASQYGTDEKALVTALGTFKGVERRLQLLLDSPKHILIDDYAHHPTEISAVFETLDDAYPKEKKCVVFQPHLFSRTQDFMADFATALAQFDQVFLLPIYPARELPIEGVTSEALAEMMRLKKEVTLLKKEEIFIALNESDARVKVLLGAGDIGLEVTDLQQKLTQNERS